MTERRGAREASSPELMERQLAAFRETFDAVDAEVGRVIVGSGDTVRLILAAVFAGGHALLEGVPGLGKTLLVKSVARALGLSFRRIQFTPDLMPSDVTGTQVLSEDAAGRRVFVFKPGAVFSHVVLADEINRATPKTQSSMLEAMEERQVTVLGETYPLEPPFFVLATQNPVELEGTYPLPEAQLDRFLVKVLLEPPSPPELKEILRRTTGPAVPEARQVLEEGAAVGTVEGMKRLARQVFVAEPLQDVLVRMIAALTPGGRLAVEDATRYFRFGPGPRGAQAVMLLAKVFALVDGRVNLSFEDLKKAFVPCLRHRCIMNFQAEADGVTADDVLTGVRDAR